MDSLVCAVDIGNTNTAVGIVNRDDLTCLETRSLQSEQCIQNITNVVEQLTVTYRASNPLPIKICTVIRSVQDEIVQTLSSLSSIGPVSLVSYHKTLPVTINYEKPELLGTDRIANCLYCIKKYPETNCIIIDAGTAVTIDMLSSSHKFIGGFIFPGIDLQLNSLHYNTAELPNVPKSTDADLFPPQLTQSAMAQGALHSVAGGISLIIQKLQKQYPAYTNILTCGGGWKTVEDALNIDCEYIPEMTLIGIGLFEE